MADGFTPDERAAVIASVVGSQALAGVAVTPEEAGALLDGLAGTPLPPILDATCWHCGRPFETRNPRRGLCPACERLADEDTRVTRIEGLGGVAPGR